MVSEHTALKTTHSWIFYINSVIKFNLNYFYFQNSHYFFKLLSVTSVICLFVLSDNLSGDISLRTFLVLYYFSYFILHVHGK